MKNLNVAGVTTLRRLSVANNATFDGNINYNSDYNKFNSHLNFQLIQDFAELNKVSVDGNISVGTIFADVGVIDTIQVKLLVNSMHILAFKV